MEQIDGVHVYRSVPAGQPRGAIIVIEEIWGVVEHIRDIADRFAAEGYLAVAPELLEGIGADPILSARLQAGLSSTDPEERAAIQPELREATSPMRAPDFAEQSLARLKLVVDALANEPGIDGRIAVTGFCFGGGYSYALAASDPRIRGAVPFYGASPTPESLSAIECPVLAFYGEDDERLMATLPQVREAFAGKDFELQLYPDAGHAFFNDTNPVTYRAADARDAWHRTLEFVARVFA